MIVTEIFMWLFQEKIWYEQELCCSLCMGTLLLIQTVKFLWRSFVTKPELLFSAVNFSFFPSWRIIRCYNKIKQVFYQTNWWTPWVNEKKTEPFLRAYIHEQVKARKALPLSTFGLIGTMHYSNYTYQARPDKILKVYYMHF